MRSLLIIPLLLSLCLAQQKPLVPMPWHQRHMKRAKIIGIAGGAMTGLVIGLLTRTGTCPKVINGYPYNGTPPCPGKNYDPKVETKGR